MSKTNESKLYNLIKTNLKNIHFMRIESYTEQGIPDVNACYNGNRPPRQRATFFYSGSLVRGSGISANEQPTFVVSPNDLTWDAAKEILWP
jgi:hypothetical protein